MKSERAVTVFARYGNWLVHGCFAVISFMNPGALVTFRSRGRIDGRCSCFCSQKSGRCCASPAFVKSSFRTDHVHGHVALGTVVVRSIRIVEIFGVVVLDIVRTTLENTPVVTL